MKRLLVFAAAVLLAAGCVRNSVDKTNDCYEYIDDYGSHVMVPQNPKRIVSLSPAVTEIMFALNAEELLVGRTEFCLYPPEASKIENIGGISNLNIEKVLSCKPDLIISGSMVPQKIVKQFEEMGVPLVCVIEKSDFIELYSNIKKIGTLVGKIAKADSINEALANDLGNMGLEWDEQRQKPSCYYVVGFGSGGNFTAGGNTFINDIILMSGGRNIAEESEGWTFSVEALMDADPDFILIRAEDSARFCKKMPYANLTAVKKGNIIALHDGILDLQVPRNIEAIRIIHKRITE